jgi:glycogen debranching enzyme
MAETKRIHKNLLNDIEALRAPDGYLNAGIPNYDHLFGRDACVSALQLLNHDPDIARSTLKTMVKYQAKHRKLMNESYPGKMLHEHFPEGTDEVISSAHGIVDKLRKLYILLLWRFPYYGSVDSGAWFIILMHRYYKKTKDEAFLREMWPAALGVIYWLEKRATNRPSGLVAYRRKYAFGLLNQSWKDTINSSLKPPTAMVEVQGYYYEAYNCLAELATDVFHNHHSSTHFTHKAQQLKKSLIELLWQDDNGYFDLAVNDHGKHDPAVTSNPGHLLFTGILSDAQVASVVSRLMADDMMTPYGIRTLSSAEVTFDATSYQEGSVWPFDNWVIYEGLRKCGYNNEAKIIKESLQAAHRELGIIPELYNVAADHTLSIHPGACTIQAWSAGALINMTSSNKPIL